MCFPLIPDAFCQVLLSIGLIGSSAFGSNCLVFLGVAYKRGLPSNPYTQHHLVWMKTALGVVGGGSFHLPHDLFHSTLL